MAVSYFPFNSVIVDGVADRPANAENLAAYLAAYFTNGVLTHDGTALRVDPGGDMNIHIKAGAGCIKGKTILNTAVNILTIQTASATQDRIDRVIIRLDETRRLMEFDVLKGIPSESPTAPELTRNADVHELCLAEIRLPAGASLILADYITDTREDADLCGYANIPAHLQDIKHGGTGATTVEEARKNLGLDDDPEVLPVESGGTGARTSTEALKNLGGIRIEKIWQNASPSSNFTAQKVYVSDLTEYDAIKIMGWTYEYVRRGTLLGESNDIDDGNYIVLTANDSAHYSATPELFTRFATIRDRHHIYFDHAYRKEMMSADAGIETDAYVVPTEIYGIKGVR